MNICCGGFAYSVIHKDSGVTELVQGGCQSNLQMSTNRHMWKHACHFCSDIEKRRRLSSNRLSQSMKHGHTTTNLPANVEAQSGNMHCHTGPRNSNTPFASKAMLTLSWDFKGPI